MVFTGLGGEQRYGECFLDEIEHFLFFKDGILAVDS